MDPGENEVILIFKNYFYVTEDNLPSVRPQHVASETVTWSVPATTTGGMQNQQEVSIVSCLFCNPVMLPF